MVSCGSRKKQSGISLCAEPVLLVAPERDPGPIRTCGQTVLPSEGAPTGPGSAPSRDTHSTTVNF